MSNDADLGIWPRCLYCRAEVYDTPQSRDFPFERGTNKQHRCAGLVEAIDAKRRGDVQDTAGLRLVHTGGE